MGWGWLGAKQNRGMFARKNLDFQTIKKQRPIQRRKVLNLCTIFFWILDFQNLMNAILGILEEDHATKNKTT